MLVILLLTAYINTLWAILWAYMALLRRILISSEASTLAVDRSTVRVNGSRCGVSGVRQGCVYSRYCSSIAVAIDWVTTKRVVEAASGRRLKWTEGDNVTDLDFADDIV